MSASDDKGTQTATANSGSVQRVVRRRTPAETWRFISEMCEHTASAEALSDIQLCECIRKEITDQMPMNLREFALIDEAVNRLAKRVAAEAPPNDQAERP